MTAIPVSSARADPHDATEAMRAAAPVAMNDFLMDRHPRYDFRAWLKSEPPICWCELLENRTRRSPTTQAPLLRPSSRSAHPAGRFV